MHEMIAVRLKRIILTPKAKRIAFVLERIVLVLKHMQEKSPSMQESSPSKLSNLPYTCHT